MLATLIMAMTSSCTASNNKSDMTTTSDNTTAAANDAKVLIKTSMGDITVLLYGDTPKHQANFLKLVKDGFYNGTLFHRVINEFMIQAGDPDSRNAAPDKHLGAGGPGYQIDAEFVYPKHFHKKGALAAARTGDQMNPERKSSGSQFYIVTGQAYSPAQMEQMEQQMDGMAKQGIFQKLAQERMNEIRDMQMRGDTAGLQRLQDELIAITEQKAAENPTKLTEEQRQAYTTVGGTPHLDGQYTVFGEVIGGMDVVDAIQKVATGAADRPVEDVKILSMEVIK